MYYYDMWQEGFPISVCLCHYSSHSYASLRCELLRQIRLLKSQW